MKFVLSCGHDGRILMWGPGGGVIDKIQVAVCFMHGSVLLFCLIITGPPNGPVLFCSLASVVVCHLSSSSVVCHL